MCLSSLRLSSASRHLVLRSWTSRPVVWMNFDWSRVRSCESTSGITSMFVSIVGVSKADDASSWSYAIKEDTGERGWAPSWYVGKVRLSLCSRPSLVEACLQVNNREKAQPQIDSPSQSSPATPLDDNASAVSSAAASLSAIPRSNSSKILPPVNTI